MRKLPILLVVTLLALLYTSLFIVNEGQRGIILRFGKVLRNVEGRPLVYAPGLHMKVPLIESVKILDPTSLDQFNAETANENQNPNNKVQ